MASQSKRSGIQVPSPHWNLDCGHVVVMTWRVVVGGAAVGDKVFGFPLVVGPTEKSLV